jgi:hypothetical protein
MILAEAPAAVMQVSQDTVYLMGAVAAGTATIMIYLNREFANSRKLVYETRRLIYRIISLHNREDDDRFAELRTGQWRLEVRNARKDGQPPPQPQPFQRRRYLAETLTPDGDIITERNDLPIDDDSGRGPT